MKIIATIECFRSCLPDCRRNCRALSSYSSPVQSGSQAFRTGNNYSLMPDDLDINLRRESVITKTPTDTPLVTPSGSPVRSQNSEEESFHSDSEASVFSNASNSRIVKMEAEETKRKRKGNERKIKEHERKVKINYKAE